MNSEQITAFLQEHWYIASVVNGAVILIGAVRNWNWLCDPTGTRDAHRHSRGYRRVVFFLLGVLDVYKRQRYRNATSLWESGMMALPSFRPARYCRNCAPRMRMKSCCA